MKVAELIHAHIIRHVKETVAGFDRSIYYSWRYRNHEMGHPELPPQIRLIFEQCPSEPVHLFLAGGPWFSSMRSVPWLATLVDYAGDRSVRPGARHGQHTMYLPHLCHPFTSDTSFVNPLN